MLRNWKMTSGFLLLKMILSNVGGHHAVLNSWFDMQLNLSLRLRNHDILLTTLRVSFIIICNSLYLAPSITWLRYWVFPQNYSIADSINILYSKYASVKPHTFFIIDLFSVAASILYKIILNMKHFGIRILISFLVSCLRKLASYERKHCKQFQSELLCSLTCHCCCWLKFLNICSDMFANLKIFWNPRILGAVWDCEFSILFIWGSLPLILKIDVWYFEGGLWQLKPFACPACWRVFLSAAHFGNRRC